MKTILFACLCFPVMAFSQQYNAINWGGNGSLNNYLNQHAHRQYDKRRSVFNKAVASPEGLQSYIKNVRAKFTEILGDLPPESPLHPKITGTILGEGYKIEKLIYESFASHHVTANLYTPARKGVFPAVLFFCGHENEAKATESYQKTAILLAKNGFVVLVIDPVSQSERFQFSDLKDNTIPRVPKIEHTLLNETSNLVGTTTPAYQIWDNKRGLDYLFTRSEVDTSKIACIGNSGGGIQAIYFSAYDKRIKVTAVCSYLSSRERKYDLDGPTDGCAEMPDEGKDLLEMSDYLIASAPSPLLILAGRFDSIDFIGTLSSVDDLKKAYRALGKPEALKLFTYDDGHGISKPKREAAATWFRKWFYNDSTQVKEKETAVLSEKQLFATASGQVYKEYPNEVSVGTRNLSLFDSLANSRKRFLAQDRKKILAGIQQLVAVKTSGAQPQIEEGASLKQNGITYRKIMIRSRYSIPMPGLIAAPAATPVKVVVWLYDKGKNKIADSTALLESYLKQNELVLMCDISGTGETEDPPSANQKKYFNKEYRNAVMALHNGGSLIGQRTTDILTVLDFLSQNKQTNNLPVEINASGVTALPALHAALFNTKIQHLNLYGSLHSFKEILQQPVEKNWYSYVINSVLKYYDIPDLVKLAGAGRISFFNDELINR